MLSSEEDRIGDVVVHPALPGCGHCPITFGYYFQDSVIVGLSGGVRRAWHRGDYGRIKEILSGLDWDLEFFGLSVDDMVSRFNSILSSLVDLHVLVLLPNTYQARFKPPRDLTLSRRQSWMGYKEVRARHGRRSREAVDTLSSFQEINVSYRNFFNRSLVAYEQSLAADLAANSKLFHKNIRSKKVGNPSVGPLKAGTTLVSDCFRMAELLADGFSSVYSIETLLDPSPHQMGAANGNMLDSVYISFE